MFTSKRPSTRYAPAERLREAQLFEPGWRVGSGREHVHEPINPPSLSEPGWVLYRSLAVSRTWLAGKRYIGTRAL
jgi:hypothetical protein